MRIAIISDIHGNLEALKATLEDINKKSVDKIICLGDIIAKGVHPVECIKLIRENCDVVIRGNTDEYFSKEHTNIEDLDETEQKRIKWNKSLISNEDREYLLNLPLSYEFYMSGSLVRLFHASPTKIDKRVLNYDSFTEKYNMFLPSEKTMSNSIADVVIYGHLHHAFLDKIYNKTIINIGSVGNSIDVVRKEKRDSSYLETTKSNYLIIEGELDSREYNSDISFTFVKVPYNVDKELEDESINIEKDAYHNELKEGRFRDDNRIKNDFKRLGIDTNKI